jgi:hypothetical protein
VVGANPPTLALLYQHHQQAGTQGTVPTRFNTGPAGP